jgi:hypothetical protein
MRLEFFISTNTLSIRKVVLSCFHFAQLLIVKFNSSSTQLSFKLNKESLHLAWLHQCLGWSQILGRKEENLLFLFTPLGRQNGALVVLK